LEKWLEKAIDECFFLLRADICMNCAVATCDSVSVISLVLCYRKFLRLCNYLAPIFLQEHADSRES